MKINNLWNEELTIQTNHRLLADQISGDLMASLRNRQLIENCEINNIEIETVNRCNNDCSFCPVNVHSDRRNKCKMDAKLFYKIINDLKVINYKGIISLYSNNEPLLDDRIYDFIKYVNDNLPEAKQELYTNGLLLTPEKLEMLSEMLDKLVIDIYSERNEIPDNMLWIKEYPETGNVIAVLRNKNQILTSRAGNSPNKECKQRYNSFCIYPFRQIVIRPDGKVSKCCHDAYGECTLGDLNFESIWDIWNGKKYKELRSRMINSGRTGIESCKKCDVLIYDYPMSYDDRTELKNELIRTVKQKAEAGRRIYIVGADNKTNSLLSEFQKMKIDYLVLYEGIRGLYLEDEKGFLLLNYYSGDILREIIKAGKRYPEDFIVYYRCF